MEKKFKFSDNPTMARIIYAAVIAILCISAIVIGIVAAASKSKEPTQPEDNPSTDIGEGGTNNEGGSIEDEQPPKDETPKPEDTNPVEPKPLVFVSPVVGNVSKHHDLTTPVFSLTLGAWKVHSGLDIATDEGAAVYAAEAGTVSKIYTDPMMGYTVEITHRDNIKTRYSCLSNSDAGMIAVGDLVESGQRIGTVGDTSVIELADEPHLHFGLLVADVAVDPLEYISEESKKASLGIEV